LVLDALPFALDALLFPLDAHVLALDALHLALDALHLALDALGLALVFHGRLSLALFHQKGKEKMSERLRKEEYGRIGF